MAHEDAVSCLAFHGDDVKNSVMITGSWDCTVRVWRELSVGIKEWKKIRPAVSLAAEFDHDSQVVCLAVSGSVYNNSFFMVTKDCTTSKEISSTIPMLFFQRWETSHIGM